MTQQTIASTSKVQLNKLFNLPDMPDAATAIMFTDNANQFIPSITSSYIHRREFLREVIAFLNNPSGDAMFVSGPTGSGKTSGICEILGRLNWPTQQITAHGRMELADLIGHHALVSGAPGEAPSMKFMYGPLAIAMREGHALLINEIDLADPAELAGLNDVLEGRPLVISQNGGEVIKAHPLFRVFVTGNSTGAGDMSGQYQGIQMQNLAAMDRYRFSLVSYPDAEVEATILEAAVPRMPKVIREGMIKVANEVRKLFMGGDGQPGTIALTMSTRTLLRWAKLALTFKKAPNALEYALGQALLNRATPEEKEAITRIAKDVLGEDQWSTGV